MSKARDSIEDLKTIDANLAAKASNTALAAKAPLASPSFTGTGSVNGKLAFFDGNTQTRNGGVATEANAALINFGLNEGSGNRFGGSYNQASQGGMLNFDTRANQPLFQIYGRAAGVAEATGTALLNIDSAGRVTKPLQPAFSAKANTQNNMGLNAWLVIAFANQRFDQNQDYASNTFTAPVTGKYQLQVSVRLDNIDTSAQYYQVRIRTSNHTYHSICDFDGMSTDPSYWNFNNSVLADMDAGDTCVVEFIQASGNSQTDINDGSYFNGYLVC